MKKKLPLFSSIFVFLFLKIFYIRKRQCVQEQWEKQRQRDKQTVPAAQTLTREIMA